MVTPQRIAPSAGQESVWDYPRPPRLERTSKRVRVIFAGDIVMAHLKAAPGSSFCEFKGVARYWSIALSGRRADNAAWSYDAPTQAFADIGGHLAFYASKVDACFVGDERVKAQSGDFYGVWITNDIVGPFKGAPGTRGW